MSDQQNTEPPFKFRGFKSPNYTNFPDEAIDELMPLLSGAEWKLLSYIIRRTFGFKKQSDNISLSQICTGITTKEGRVLDRGTGLSKSTAQIAIKGLLEKEVIIAVKRSSLEKGYEATCYSLNLQTSQNQTTTQTPYTENRYSPPMPEIGIALYRKSVIQETVIQETDLKSISKNRLVKNLEEKPDKKGVPRSYSGGVSNFQEQPSEINQEDREEDTSNNRLLHNRSSGTNTKQEDETPNSNEPESVGAILTRYSTPRKNVEPTNRSNQRRVNKEEREHIRSYFLTFLKTKLNDENEDGSVGRAINIFMETNLSKEMYFTKATEALKATLKANIKKPRNQGATFVGQKNRAPYFFQTLREKCGLKETH